MIKFFRKIRQKLLSENKFSKYLIYAIGEIILVVIGILIALQINNANQDRIFRKEEIRILKSFKNEVKRNISLMNNTIKEKKNIIEIDDYLLTFCGPNAKWDSKRNFDNLMQDVIISGWMYFPNDGTLTEVLNSGKLSVIKNDSLRNLISSLPSRISVTQEEEKNYRIDLHEYFLPFISKHFQIRNSTAFRNYFNFTSTDLKKSIFDSNPEFILREKEFENILSIQSIWLKFTIDMLESQKKISEEILQLINDELVE